MPYDLHIQDIPRYSWSTCHDPKEVGSGSVWEPHGVLLGGSNVNSARISVLAGFSRRITPLVIGFAAVWFLQSVPGQQRPSANRPITPVIGTVKAISGDQITVESGDRTIIVTPDAHTEIWKGKTSHDLSQVQIGDDFAGR